jgi:hypothetical protein
MRRAPFALLLAALLSAGPAFANCPLCAGSGSPRDVNIWPIVGAFMCLPWILGAAAVLLMRREFRTTFGGRPAGDACGHLLAFTKNRPPHVLKA